MAEVVSFQVAYDGPALQSGRMDVRDLAPALLAIGELCQQASRVLSKDGAHVSVNVTTDFQRGSFQVDLEFVQTLIQKAQDLLFSREVGTGLALAATLGLAKGAQVSLLALFKFLRGRRPESSTTLRNGDVRLTIVNNIHIDVRPEVVVLYNDPEIRRQAREVVRPLDRQGIDSFETRQRGEVVERVEKADLPAFEIVEAERELAANEQESVVKVVKPSFSGDLKWTLSNGIANFYADITDESFLNRVKRRDIVFGQGDLLRVRMFVQTYASESGNIKNIYTIREVLEVLQPPRQISLDDGHEESSP